MPNCILVVDDDVQVLRLVRRILEKNGYQAITADSGESALVAFDQQPVDLVVLDITLPGIDGYPACQRIRTSSHVPIIMLTAHGGDKEVAKGLNAGADDYVAKPFSVEVLLARVRAALRRSQATFPTPSVNTFSSNNIEIHFATRRVLVDTKEIKITRTEFCILQELALNAGKVLSHTYLLRQIWGQEYQDERQYLHVFIRSLRTKLGLKHQGQGTIESIAGVGYRFNV
jgi:DNA-binding response OmpR family regulator